MVFDLIHYHSNSQRWHFSLLARVLIYALGISALLIILAILRLVPLLSSSKYKHHPRRSRSSENMSTHLLVLLGSGGHTSEMLSMLSNARISPSLYSHRTYVISSGDGFSAEKAQKFEESLARVHDVDKSTGSYDIQIIPRARKIHQPLLTTPISALKCLISALKLLRDHPHGYPDLIITNGPGTGVVIVLASLIVRFFAMKNKHQHRLKAVAGKENVECGQMRTIFIESWARVKTLSLTGKILLPVVNRFMVQWKGLEGKGKKAEYVGFLI